jgi:hypothetical protein
MLLARICRKPFVEVGEVAVKEKIRSTLLLRGDTACGGNGQVNPTPNQQGNAGYEIMDLRPDPYVLEWNINIWYTQYGFHHAR